MEQKWTNKLTNEEFEFISSTYYPLLKKGAMEKVQAQLAALGKEMEQLTLRPDRNITNGAKISKGENYQWLPYMVLDYPKIAGEGFDMLCRVVFWWGKYVGLQFFLNQQQHQTNLLLAQLIKEDINDLYVLTNTQIWNNDISEADFKLLSALTIEQILALQSLPYLKLVWVQPIKKPDNLFEQAIGFYKKLLLMQGLTT